MFTDQELKLAEELVKTILFINSKGWSPATSTNYSVRERERIIISRSGVDKNLFTFKDLILINSEGEILPSFKESNVRSSAETEIHTAIYKRFPEINCVLHTHSLLGTMLSHLHAKEGELKFEGLEIIKGLEDNSTHDMTERLPIVTNSQSMPEILEALEPHFKSNTNMHGFLIAGHGLYTWGRDIATAKRHVETFEFLLECFQLMRRS